jgi:hypothetical protein
MKLTKVFATLTVASMLALAAPKQPTPVVASCLAGSPQTGECHLGAVVLNGSNYGNLVEIVDNGTSLGFYQPRGGNLDVTLDFSATADLGAHVINVVDASGKGKGSVIGCAVVDMVP